MKTVLLKLSGMWLFFLFTLQALAQTDKKVDVDINVGKNNSNWYQQPWVWVVGGAVFIIILVALLSGRGKKE
jgi:hypothetical protein